MRAKVSGSANPRSNGLLAAEWQLARDSETRDARKTHEPQE
jgi:hypothetical protein